ncbi:hypothetical protein SVAN01_11546, partial [Stagonosporopsis vannaccii]
PIGFSVLISDRWVLIVTRTAAYSDRDHARAYLLENQQCLADVEGYAFMVGNTGEAEGQLLMAVKGLELLLDAFARVEYVHYWQFGAMPTHSNPLFLSRFITARFASSPPKARPTSTPAPTLAPRQQCDKHAVRLFLRCNQTDLFVPCHPLRIPNTGQADQALEAEREISDCNGPHFAQYTLRMHLLHLCVLEDAQARTSAVALIAAARFWCPPLPVLRDPSLWAYAFERCALVVGASKSMKALQRSLAKE